MEVYPGVTPALCSFCGSIQCVSIWMYGVQMNEEKTEEDEILMELTRKQAELKAVVSTSSHYCLHSLPLSLFPLAGVSVGVQSPTAADTGESGQDRDREAGNQERGTRGIYIHTLAHHRECSSIKGYI